jgi:hypothetical protein
MNRNFAFIYELEPAAFCSNLRCDSSPFWTTSSPIRSVSFSFWQNMLVVFYRTGEDQHFEAINAEADYIATAIVACYGFVQDIALRYSPRNWVESQGTISKTIVGTFEEGIHPVLERRENEALKKVAGLMSLVLSNPPLIRSLQDFYSCLLSVNPDFYFYAYRAIEDIRSHFQDSEDEKDRSVAWRKMNAALKHEEKDYAALKRLSERYRHGNRLGEGIDPESVEEQRAFVRVLIGEFIAYLSKPTADKS